MESALLEVGNSSSSYSSLNPLAIDSIGAFEAARDQLILDSLDDDSALDDTARPGLSQGLALTAREIVDKLNQLLKGSLPQGIETLAPEDVTAEATADRVVTGIVALFGAYSKQNSNLSGEELVSNFMKLAREGVSTGYDQAYQTLDGLGAFGIEGVKDGVEQTKILIESKLQAFEKHKLAELSSTAQT